MLITEKQLGQKNGFSHDVMKIKNQQQKLQDFQNACHLF